ncbi:MAG: C40 family peptidase [Clostridia bacterium]|nr:C40 family peptidase [Clostridia bacterium]
MAKIKTLIAALAVLATAATVGGCNADYNTEGENGNGEQITAPQPEQPEPEIPAVVVPPVVPEPPKPKTVSYLSVKADNVNIRSGAGTGYSSKGTAEKSTMYALNGLSDGWYKTGYKNNTAYISSKYCDEVEMLASDDDRVEAVIAEGAKLLGTVYVYGAVRYHDGNGHLLKNFTTTAFDCSSLMQYIFYKGAHVNLQVNTRTQIYQGTTVKKSELKRGDLMFFTNASRKNNKGIERVGHVALYLGDNWILHTASDYAKIEQITPLRWSYFIQGQRII